MSKFHVNPDSGASGKCNATVKDCPYGGETGTENHYATKIEAEQAGNKILRNKYGSFNVHTKSKLIDETESINTLEKRAKNLRELLSDLPRYDEEYDEIESNYFQTINDIKKKQGNAQLLKDGIVAPPKPTKRPAPSMQEQLNRETEQLNRMIKALNEPYEGGFDPEAHMEYNDNIIRLKQEIPKQRKIVQELQNKKPFAQKALQNNWMQLLPAKNREQIMSLITADTNEGDTEFIRGTAGIKNSDARKLRGAVQQRLRKRIEQKPAEWKEGQKVANDLTGVENNPKRKAYIDSINNKHFAKNDMGGSKFTDKRLTKAEDAISLALAQRGGLKGDDRDKLIASGADPNAFLPPESGVRYIQVKANGTEATKSTADMKDDEILTVQAKDPNDPKSSLSFVATVKEQPKTSVGTIIIGPKEDSNGEPIKGTETLWTMHPGSPTRGIRSNDIREKGLKGGSTITVKELREKFGKDIKANTKVIE